jgi:glycosyltransferase involved in cell wall biosynthesis
MKVALISSAEADPSTGVGAVSLNLQKQLQKLGHHCRMYFFTDVIPAPKNVFWEAVFSIYVIFCFKLSDFDVLDVTAGDGLGLAIRASLIARRKRPILVARSHGLEHVIDESNRSEAKSGKLKLSWKYPFYHGGFRLWQVRRYLNSADMTLFLNAYDRQYAIEELGVCPETAEIVDNGIPDIFLRRVVSFEAPADIRVALVGTFLQRKGIDYSVPALNALLQKHDRLSVTFFGTGVPVDVVLSWFDPAVAERVQVMQRYDHENLPGLLKGFHILLFPSLTEGFPLAPLESMACGLAAVVSRIPWVAARLEDGVNAIIIPPKDQAAIEDAVRRLIEDPDLLMKLRKAGYEFAQGYSWRRVSESTLRLYQQAIERKSLEESR